MAASNPHRLSANKVVDPEISDLMANHLIDLASSHLGNVAHTLYRIGWGSRADDSNYTILALCSTGALFALVEHSVVSGGITPEKISIFRASDVSRVSVDTDGVFLHLTSGSVFLLPSNTKASDVLSSR